MQALKFLTAAGVAVATHLLAAAPLAAQQPAGSVEGEVVDGRTRRGVTGAQVYVVNAGSVSGTGVGTVTDARGRYVLSGVPAGPQTVEARHIGYRTSTQTTEVRAGATTTVSFELQESAVALDAIVVTGTAAATRRVEIGNALTQLNAADIREAAPISNLSQMLQTRASGVRVAGRSGMVGAGADITIRGGSSLTLSSRPIIYIDGVRVDNTMSSGPRNTGAGTPSRLDDIPPEDIESIEIIKGPAAATLYGTEASNGVIQIITRRGSPGAAPTITAAIRQGAQWLHNPAELFGSNYRLQPDGTVLEQNLIEEEEAAGRPIFRTGHLQNYAVSVQGGADRLAYFISGELDNTEGYIPNNELTRLGGRANLNVSLFETLDLEISSGITRSKIDLVPEGFSPNFGLVPMISFGDPRTRDTPLRGFSAAPPEATRTIELRSDVDRSNLSFRTTFRPFSWLTSRLTLGTDVVNEINTSLYPRQPEGLDHFFSGRGLGEIAVDTRRARAHTMDFSTSGKVELTPALVSTTSVGIQYFGRRVDQTGAFGREFPAIGVRTVSAAAVTQATESWVDNKTVGAFIQQHVGFNDRLFITAAVRGDDNSAFGQGFDAAIYPKLSASWLISSEPFFFQTSFLDELRLRASWGRSGLQPDAFAAVQLYAPITGPNNVATLTPGAVGNPDLGPEVGEEIEVGLDASLFENRVALGLTYFDSKTKDAILARTVPPSTGFAGTQFVNIGELAKHGLEVEARVRPLASERLGWEVGATFSKISNEIVSLGGLPPIITGYRETQAHVEGFPIGAFFSRKIIEATRDPVTGNITSFACDGGTGPEGRFRLPGGAAVPCANAPSIYFGQPGPGTEGTIFSTLDFLRSFSLFVNFAVASDYRIQSVTRSARTFVFNISKEWVDLRQGDPIFQAYVQNNYRIASMEEADYVRLREISLTHRFDAGLLNRFGFSRASISLAGRNVATWTKFTGLDPEVRSNTEPWGNQEQTLVPVPMQFVVTFSATR
jgi:TonB-linked SusC/RagA family outer membrane protein